MAPAAPTNAPSSSSDFSALGVDRVLVSHLRNRMGIDGRPTEIQRSAIPPLVATPPSALAARDVLMQAQTGSGKTLAYLLPIVQSLLPLSHESFIDRSIGTLAIVLAPTRELARQIYQVLEKLLTLSFASADGADGESTSKRYARWIVPGLLVGGSTKNHEKQRLRKGCTVLVATPGRLLDHLQNTASFDVGKCRWLVLDEADRLLEMGFEEQLNGIVRALDGRRRLARTAAREALERNGALDPRDANNDAAITDSLGIAWWAWRRRAVLCSATLDEHVQAFAGTTLNEPLLVRAGMTQTEDVPKFSAPAQLQQHAVIVPPKLRLVSLVALLRAGIRRGAQSGEPGPTRIIVFLTSTDSVDFHWRALGGVQMRNAADADGAERTGAENTEDTKAAPPVAQHSELLADTPIYRLHGSMSQSERIASLRAFQRLADGAERRQGRPARGGVLLCTSVASRGLDLPDVRSVIQMDVPTEDSVEEYVHRIGRTARVGRQGTSWLMLLPHEAPWLDTLEERMVVGGRPAHLERVACDTVLFQGYGGAAREFESRATDVQMALERWVLRDTTNASLARTAFLAHVRAYATHPASERAIFNVRQLHLGHLAKAFALREAPNTVQRTSKREHEEHEGKRSKDPTRERKRRMLANLPEEAA